MDTLQSTLFYGFYDFIAVVDGEFFGEIEEPGFVWIL